MTKLTDDILDSVLTAILSAIRDGAAEEIFDAAAMIFEEGSVTPAEAYKAILDRALARYLVQYTGAPRTLQSKYELPGESTELTGDWIVWDDGSIDLG